MLRLLSAMAGLLAACCARGAEPHELTVDFAQPAGTFRAIHGINKGPLSANGLVDVREFHKALRLPTNRLHDCHHPNPDVVDIHSIFPDPRADPALPGSYDFRATDEYLAATQATGAQIIYRLGESIEHQTVKRHVHPPEDPARWAEVCAGIVRHCNEGWAGGGRMGIRYWEIWNEPENRPVMWTGSDAQYLELYRLTALRLKKEFPDIRIGGPAFGYCGKFDGSALEPSEFCAAFLDMCRRESLPLDFFSWHCYTNDPSELAARCRAVRAMLDARGFSRTESHLNEWNYLPGNSWDVLSRTASPQTRQLAMDAMTGAEGGAFLVAGLIAMQDAPVDMTNFYHGETGNFGLFTEVGAPWRNYHALLAFSRMADSPRRVSAAGAQHGKLHVLAGTDEARSQAGILIANLSGPAELDLILTNMPGGVKQPVLIDVVDSGRALERAAAPDIKSGRLHLQLRPPAVALITLTFE